MNKTKKPKINKIKKEKNKKDKKERLTKLNLIKIYLKSNFFEFLILISTIFLIFFFTLESFLSLKSLPTCIYGCDYYWEHGNVLSVINNPTETWRASHHLWFNESDSFPLSAPKGAYYLRVPFYLFFDYYESWKGTILYSLFFSLISFFAYFLLFRIIFSNNLISLLLAFINIRLANFPYFKYNNLVFLLLPFLILSVYWIFSKFNLKNKKHYLMFFLILLFYLIFSNLHSWAFFGLFYFLFFAFLLKFLLFKKERKEDIIKFSITSFLTFILALLPGWWFYIIFKLKGFNWEILTAGAFPDLTQWKNYFSLLFNYLKNLFFDFSSFLNILFTASFYLGLFYLAKNYKNLNKKEKFFILLLTITTLFAIFNYLITIPIFKKHLSPSHAFSFLNLIFKSLFLGFALFLIRDFVKKYFSKIVFALFLVFFLFSIKNYFSKYDLWYYKNGLIDLKQSFPHYSAFVSYLKENNLNPNKMVILTTNELSFALYGLTGIQTFNGRLSHFFHFANFQKIWLDSTIILYSKNKEEQIKKLREYCKIIKDKDYELYLWWDFYWINSEWQITNQGIKPFDPLRFFDKSNWNKIGYNPLIKYFDWNIDVEKELIKNNISFTKSYFFFDENFNKYSKIWKIIYIDPKNYYNLTHPWSNSLDKYLKKVWNFKAQTNQGIIEIAKLYKIECEKLV